MSSDTQHSDKRREATMTRIVQPTHDRLKAHTREGETLSGCLARALDALEMHEQLLELAFSSMDVTDTDATPIVHLSDGPRLLLADGSVVYPRVTDADGEHLPFIAYDQGACRHGFEEQQQTSIAFVDDPDGREHDAVREALEDDA